MYIYIYIYNPTLINIYIYKYCNVYLMMDHIRMYIYINSR